MSADLWEVTFSSFEASIRPRIEVSEADFFNIVRQHLIQWRMYCEIRVFGCLCSVLFFCCDSQLAFVFIVEDFSACIFGAVLRAAFDTIMCLLAAVVHCDVAACCSMLVFFTGAVVVCRPITSIIRSFFLIFVR